MKSCKGYISLFIIIFFIGISIFSILTYLASLFWSADINVLQGIFILSMITSFLVERKLKSSQLLSIDRNVLWATLIIIIPYIIYFFDNNNFYSSYHFDYHYGYVRQIIESGIPPSNIYGYGLPATTYWCYHALIAVLSTFTFTPPEFLFQIVNFIAALFAISVANSLLHHYTPHLKKKFLWIIFLLFAMNLFGGVAYGIRLMLNGSNVIFKNFHQSVDFFAFLLRIPIQYKSIFIKYLFFHSVPIAYAFFLFNVLYLVKKKTVSSYLALTTNVLIHPTIAIIPLLVNGVIILNKNLRKLKNFIRIDFIIYVFINLLYLSFILLGRENFGSGNITIELFNPVSWLGFTHSILPLIGIFFLFYLFRRNSSVLNHQMLWRYSVVLLVASLFLNIKVHNQYKFAHEFSMLFALLIVIAMENVKKSMVIKWLSILIITSLFIKISLLQLGFAHRLIHKTERFYTVKGEIKSIYPEEQEIIKWLKVQNEKTPVLLIIPPAMKKITAYSSAAGVKIYARKYWIFTDTQAFHERFGQCRVLYGGDKVEPKISIIKKIQNEYKNMKVLFFVPKPLDKLQNNINFNTLKNFKQGNFYELK